MRGGASIRYLEDEVARFGSPGSQGGGVAVNRKFLWQYGKARLVGHCERLRGSNNIKRAYRVCHPDQGTTLSLFIASVDDWKRGGEFCRTTP